MPGVFRLWLAAPTLAAAARPGQFAMLRVADGLDPLLRRPLSVHRVGGRRLDSASDGRPSEVAFLYEVRGRGTALLSQRQPGETVDVIGPLGRGFAVQRGAQNLLLVGGGIGVAPLVMLAEAALRRGRSVTLLLGAATAARLYPEALLPPEVELAIATEDGSAGRQGLVTDLLPDYADWADQVFACGPEGMYFGMARRVPDLARRKSVQVLLEARMGCGMGVCLGCAVETRRGYRLCCRDGPRFELRDLV